MRKNEEIREKSLGTDKEIKGKCNTKTRSEWGYSRWLKLQLNKLSAAVLMLSFF
jgi:hypothetical protein